MDIGSGPNRKQALGGGGGKTGKASMLGEGVIIKYGPFRYLRPRMILCGVISQNLNVVGD